MASSSADSHSQARRPTPMARQASTSSQVSPSDAPPRPAPKAPRQHVVGHSRMQRNVSGKNLSKLNKPKEPRGDDGNAVKHHRRSHSGNSTSAPSSPRPSFKRNASSGGVVRGGNNHGHTQIRKNVSSGHLARQSASKPALKSSKSEVAVHKRSLINPEKARRSPTDASHVVHFDVGDDDDDEGPDDGWTEESASQSPTTTRSNTRSNSVIMDPHRAAQSGTGPAQEESRTDASLQHSRTASNTALHTHTLPEHAARQTNGPSSHHQHSRPPDADIITSRLLQRSSHHNAPPQISNVTTTVVANHNNIRELSQSAGSTLVDTPGKDLVSRFMDGEGSAGTANNSSFLPSRGSPQTGGEMEAMKRNRSMPNVGGAETPARTPSRRSGASTPTDLPVSRTQQKLMLQRASSNIEPQKLVPAILPQTGRSTFLHTGMTYSADGEARLDPRLQQQFNQIAVEYNVVRRYRNPIADALARIEQIPGAPRKTRVPKPSGINGQTHVRGGSLSTSFNDETERQRPRVSFENGRSGDEGDVEGRQSFESDNGRIRNEAEEICRRLWESAEAVEHD